MNSLSSGIEGSTTLALKYPGRGVEFQKLSTEGSSMTVEQAIALAMES